MKLFKCLHCGRKLGGCCIHRCNGNIRKRNRIFKHIVTGAIFYGNGNQFKQGGNMKTWDELKAQGSEHYKTEGGVEPIDLYKAGFMFRHFALCSIIKYAFRNRNASEPLNIRDLDKIIDYAEKLKASVTDKE